MALDDKTQSINTTTYMPPEEKDVRWLFDYRIFTLEIHAKLKGGYLQESKKGMYEIITDHASRPMLNQTGIAETMAILNGFVDKIQALSVYDENRILRYNKALWKNLATLYYVNMERYELVPSKATLIISMIVNLFESNMRKSLGGIGLRLIGLSEKIVEQKSKEKKLLPF